MANNALRTGIKPRKLIDFETMSESEQKKRVIYAERSRLKRQEHLLARSPQASDPIVPYLFSQTFAGTE
jgi:hypothetical protein